MPQGTKLTVTLLGVLACVAGSSRVMAQGAVVKLPERALFRLGDDRLHHRSPIRCLAFSPDGRYIAAAETNVERGVRLWDARTGNVVTRLVPRNAELEHVYCLDFSPDGRQLLVGEEHGWIALWDVEQRRIVHRDQQHKWNLNVVVFGPGGDLFATGGDDGWLRVFRSAAPGEPIWSRPTYDPLPEFQFKVERIGVAALRFTPDGAYLVAGIDVDATLLVLRADTGELVQQIKHAHAAGTSTDVSRPVQSVWIGPDGTWAISSGGRYVEADKLPRGINHFLSHASVSEVRAWEIPSLRRLRDFTADRLWVGYGSATLSDDGTTIACVGKEQLDLLDVKTGRPIRSIPVRRPYAQPSFSPDGSRVAAAVSGSIGVWDVSTGARLFHDRPAHDDSVHAVDCSPDGRLIATGSSDNRLNIWSAGTHELLWSARLAPDATLNDLQFSPDSRLIAACGLETLLGGWFGVLVVWTRDGQEVFRTRLEERAHFVSFAPDGERLAVVHDGIQHETKIRIFNIERNIIELELPRNGDRVDEDFCTVRFSADGRFVLTADSESIVRQWDTLDAAADRTFAADWRNEEERSSNREPWISDAAFTADGALLVTSAQGRLYLWDVASGTLKGSIAVPEAHGCRIGMGSDARTLAVSEHVLSDAPGTDVIRIFDLEARQEVLTLLPVDARAMDFAFSPDNKRLLSGFDNGTGIVWDVSR